MGICSGKAGMHSSKEHGSPKAAFGRHEERKMPPVYDHLVQLLWRLFHYFSPDPGYTHCHSFHAQWLRNHQGNSLVLEGLSEIKNNPPNIRIKYAQKREKI